MAVRKSAPVINNIPYEEFNDNETLEKLIDELNAGGVNAMVAPLDKLIDWGRSNSLWPLTFATSCCGIEFMAVAAARYDMARFGFEITRNSPRQGDVLLVNGTITTKMAPVVKRLYDQMCDPKYVIAVGGCAISGGPFTKSYHVVKGVDKILPVDVYCPGCRKLPLRHDAAAEKGKSGKLLRNHQPQAEGPLQGHYRIRLRRIRRTP